MRRLFEWLDQKERRDCGSFERDITDPAQRKRSIWLYNWLDHGILRRRWHNFEEIAPGVYRSNHPHHARFVAYAEMGIKAVLNLRGESDEAHHLFEKESCEALGLQLVNVPMGARAAAHGHRLLMLLDAFEAMPQPFMMHCKSGADRTGLAAAFYLLIYTDASDAEVRRQLSFRYLHIRKSSTGILDHILDTYLTARQDTGIGLRQWIETVYVKKDIVASYERKKAQERFWQGW